MELAVKVINQNLVKPSSPTPEHLRRYQLSFLDQISPPVFMPLIFFYPHNSGFTNSQRCDLIKKSLSEVLSRFYPLAGRLNPQDSIIECNDEGVHCAEATANCELSSLLEDPDPNQYKKLLPFELYDVQNLLLAVQVTYFDCGALALGVAMSHKFCDALSTFMFVRSWAKFACGQEEEAVNPVFDAAAIFPPMDIVGFNASVGITKEKIVNKRFVFSNSAVKSLKDKYSANMDGQQVTRVEALSVFIWNRFMVSTTGAITPDQDDKIYGLIHAVNLRSRADPPIPDNVFGNLYRVAITVPSANGVIDEKEDWRCGMIAKQIRDEKNKIDAEYVKSLQEGAGHLSFIKEMSSSFLRGKMETFNFTSLCRFPLYDADFGWGKPVWIASTVMSFKNLVTFFDTKEGDGVEAWINLEETDMAKFEADHELLSHLSPNPSVKISSN